MKRCNLRIQDLEFRTCTDSLQDDGIHTTGQVVEWRQDTCYTVAMWKFHDDVHNIHFVGTRPFAAGRPIWELLEYGQIYLTKESPL